MSTITLGTQVPPAAPGAGKVRFYTKTDGLLRRVDADGGEVVIGPGHPVQFSADLVVPDNTNLFVLEVLDVDGTVDIGDNATLGVL